MRSKAFLTTFKKLFVIYNESHLSRMKITWSFYIT